MKPTRTKRFLLYLVISLVIGLGVTGTIILGLEYRELKNKLDSNDAKVVLSRLQKHLQTPEEQPVVATVIDAYTLKMKEPFYKNAENGDKVIVWKDRALIYRMENEKIIDWGVAVRNKQKKNTKLDVEYNRNTDQDVNFEN